MAEEIKPYEANCGKKDCKVCSDVNTMLSKDPKHIEHYAELNKNVKKDK